MSEHTPPHPPLTSLAHGGGCGCKIGPAVLAELLEGQAHAAGFPQLLVGNDSSDDAAVWQIDETTAIVSTTDFFMPMVDDPYDFGRIAAANAISDIYAMGGRPIFALAILGMPIDKLPAATIRRILEGGAAICAEAGIAVAGGHSIDAPEPIYGLAVTGLVDPAKLRRNRDAQVGDALILTKGLGVGIYSSAIKKGLLDEAGLAEMVDSTTQLNRAGQWLADEDSVHALTDVTGFGILGHGLEVARGANVSLHLKAAALPRLSQADRLAEAGCITGASGRNWQAVQEAVTLPEGISDGQKALLSDPQTSGGLLISCADDQVDRLIERLHQDGARLAARIGHVEAGPAGIVVA